MRIEQVGAAFLGVAGIVGLLGCNGSPTSPSPAGTGSRFVLAAGNYTLTLSVSQTQPPAPPGESPCRQNSLAAASAALPVVVTRESGAFKISPIGEADQGFVALLRSVANSYAGTAAGRALDPTSRVEVVVTPFPEVPGLSIPRDQLSALPGNAAGLQGTVNAEVEFSRGLGRRNCPVNEWRLEPR